MGEEEREAPPAPGDPPNPEAPPGLEGPQIHMEPPVPEGLQGPEDVKGERQGREEEVQDKGPGAKAGRSGAVAHAQLGSLPKPQGMDSGVFLGRPTGAVQPPRLEGPAACPQQRYQSEADRRSELITSSQKEEKIVGLPSS